jgi:hypothetical protein
MVNRALGIPYAHALASETCLSTRTPLLRVWLLESEADEERTKALVVRVDVDGTK